jgi:uncharacterized protein YkwD
MARIASVATARPARSGRRLATALVAVAAAAGSALGVAGTASAATVPTTVASSAASTPSYTTPTTVAMENQFLTLLNARRTANGDVPMTMSSDLVALSRTWSEKMATGVGLAHDPNLATEIQNWEVAGQNVGVGTDVPTLDNAFWMSPLHRQNELYPTFTQVGIGVVIDSTNQVWVTFDFRQPLVTTPAPVAPVANPAPKAVATTSPASLTIAVTRHATKLTVRGTVESASHPLAGRTVDVQRKSATGWRTVRVLHTNTQGQIRTTIGSRGRVGLRLILVGSGHSVAGHSRVVTR